MILLAGPHSSASLNPAVSISQTVLALGPLKNRVADSQFWHVYMMGPFAGAMFAGFASWAHHSALENFGLMPLSQRTWSLKEEMELTSRPNPCSKRKRKQSGHTDLLATRQQNIVHANP